jgi:hypothetical protein
MEDKKTLPQTPENGVKLEGNPSSDDMKKPKGVSKKSKKRQQTDPAHSFAVHTSASENTFKLVRNGSNGTGSKKEGKDKDKGQKNDQGEDPKDPNAKYADMFPEAIKKMFSTQFLEQMLAKSQEISDFMKKNQNNPGVPARKDISDMFNNTKFPAQSMVPTQKKIGTLTVEERRIKLEKYLVKRKMRTWSKKIAYDCRKRVADSRLRVKGRFVTKDQAISILCITEEEFNRIGTDELRNMLT